MKLNDIVSCKVTNIFPTHMLVSLGTEWKGLIHVSDISDYYVLNIKGIFNVGERYWFEVKEIDTKDNRVKLSWKSIMPRFLKDPFVFEIKETPNGFNNLLSYVGKEILND